MMRKASWGFFDGIDTIASFFLNDSAMDRHVLCQLYRKGILILFKSYSSSVILLLLLVAQLSIDNYANGV